ncbi:LysM peptidoglycan-binding domain-containing protein [Pseudomonas aeruginosa]|uniref:LysM peptidoglycan-binding domain-containing protein n=1 Tax=Pseudomonas aeruginosa TaxID=287 RepID=UPI00249B9A3B|nr:hypothetical protein [Pseudomonas aeruginosa]WGX44974.1 hypothetical protein P7I92_12070 [Pseudomonas aeruginosa]
MQQNENFAKQDEQAEAEAERPEVFGLERYRVERTGQGFWPYCVRAGDGTRELFVGHLKQCKRVAAQLATAFEDGKFVAGALRAELETERMRLAGCGVAALGYFDGCADAYKSASLSDVLRLRADCDAALARVAELESATSHIEVRQCVNCRHIGINDAADYAACHDCRWTGPEPDEDKCPGCGSENCMAAACPECGGRYELVAETDISAPPAQAQHSVPAYVSYTTQPAESLAGIALRQLKDESRWVEIRDINAHAFPDMRSHSYYPAGTVIKLPAAAPGKEVPQAWIDVQEERRRQVEAGGWTPEHDDQHSHGQMARAAACYALAGSSAPNDGTAALLVSLAWPWDQQWWKPTSARRDLVKACALALAEIERLDRACISQSPQPGATTASS